MIWKSTKTYGHEEGLSTCFRQWRAEHSHCRFLHGYALSFKFTFASFTLDDRNWVMDFGGLQALKAWLRDTFDHKTVVATDDPDLPKFRQLEEAGLCDLVEVPATGCERFAELAGQWAQAWLDRNCSRVRCIEVECREHGANSAIWMNP